MTVGATGFEPVSDAWILLPTHGTYQSATPPFFAFGRVISNTQSATTK